MVAAMTLKFLDPFGSGKLVLFQVTYDRVRHWIVTTPGSESTLMVLIGVAGLACI